MKALHKVAFQGVSPAHHACPGLGEQPFGSSRSVHPAWLPSGAGSAAMPCLGAGLEVAEPRPRRAWQPLLTTRRPQESQTQPSESPGPLCKGDPSPLRKGEEQKSIVCSPSSLGPPLPLLHHHHHHTRTLFTLLEGDICY